MSFSYFLIGKTYKLIYYKPYCISPNVGRYYGLVTGPPPPMEATMEAMEAAAMEYSGGGYVEILTFVCLFVCL